MTAFGSAPASWKDAHPAHPKSKWKKRIATAVHGSNHIFFWNFKMTASTNLFPSTPCETSYIEYMREEGDRSGYKTPLLEHCGYSLIANQLVPEIFIQRVIEQMHGGNYEYGLVLSKDDIFDSEFLSGLDAQEHEVLMLVVLEAVARGDFEMHLWTDPAADEECEDEAL